MRGTTSFDVLSVNVRAGVSAVGDWKNPQKQKTRSSATAEKQRVSCPHGGG